MVNQSEEDPKEFSSNPVEIHPIAECIPVFSCDAESNAILTATATKPTPSSPTGLSLGDHPWGGVVLLEIPQDSLFSGSPLRAGMKVLSINDTDCQTLHQQAANDLLQSCPGQITIRATHVDWEAHAVVATAIPTTSSTSQNPTTPTTTTTPPPPGAPEGGHWGTGLYFGPSNRLLFCLVCSLGGILGLCTLNCKLDRRVYYRAPNGTIYNEAGDPMRYDNVHFESNPPGITGKQPLPPHPVETTLGHKVVQGLVPCGIVVFLVWFLIVVVVRFYREKEEDCEWKYCEVFDPCKWSDGWSARNGRFSSHELIRIVVLRTDTNSFKTRYVEVCGDC
jgi:hypothetical protein